MNLFYITNNVSEAKIVDKLNIDWIFIDLETIGKKTRQAGRNTVLSNHSISDIKKIKSKINNTKILVRCNPIGNHSIKEIEQLYQASMKIKHIEEYHYQYKSLMMIGFMKWKKKQMVTLMANYFQKTKH